MPKKPVSIGSLNFTSKGEAHEFLKTILNRYNPGEDVLPEDANVLRDALNNHPNAQAKIGCGIAGFRVRSAEYRTQCFWVMRTDGSSEKFSYLSCI
jgi:hypothetical protein